MARGDVKPVIMTLMAVLLAAVVMAMAPPAQAPDAARAKAVNVLFVVADDLNTDLGAYGVPVQTPNIDRLARRGVRFEQAYCQYPLCSPSRASFLTGRRPNVTGVLTNPGTKTPMSPHFRERLPETITLPQLFRNNGWFVARVGKLYHFGVPGDIGNGGLDDNRSWDLAINPRGRDRELHDRIFSLQPGQFGGTLSWLADEGDDGEHTDGLGAAEAVRLLERFKKENRSFFLGVGFYRPHTPYVAPKRYFDLYPPDRIGLPSLAADDRTRKPEAAYGSARKEQDGIDDAVRRQAIQAYRASTTFMDAQAGIVFDALGRLGLADTTVVIFTSDHGYHLGDHGLWQKMSVFERSARVPLIVAAPGRKGNGRAAAGVVELVDLYPTLAALAGLQAPDYLDGVSLAAMLDDPQASAKTAAYTQVRDGYSVRTARWRYTEWDAGSKGVQLYDMEHDPRETTNLADDPNHAPSVAELKSLLQRYRSR